MQLRAGEDAVPGPGARGTFVVLGPVECARDMRCPSRTPGTGGQDGRARTCGGRLRTSAVVFAIYVLEVNASCYLERSGEFPTAAVAAGIEYPALIQRIVESAFERRPSRKA